MSTVRRPLEEHTALVIEHDPGIRTLLRQSLGIAGYAVDEVDDGSRALDRVRNIPYEIILLDVGMPVLDGFSFCRAIRSDGRNRETPIVIVSARAGEADTVLGLESGADDYVAKPFGMRELMARVDAIVRRRRWAHAANAAHGVSIDRLRRRITVDDRLIDTTRQEFDLLDYLASRPGVPTTREMLLDNVWQNDPDVSVRTVDALICRLRRKIEPNPHRPRRLVTAWGVGYMFVEPEQKKARTSAPVRRARTRATAAMLPTA